MYKKPLIAQAKWYHNVYIDRLISWYDWVNPDKGGNKGQKMLLYNLVRQFVEMRKVGQPFDKAVDYWSEIRDDLSKSEEERDKAREILRSIPSHEEMKSAAGIGSPTSNFSKFGAELQLKRKEIEDLMQLLLDVIESDDFKKEYHSLSIEDQLKLSAELSEGISASDTGLIHILNILENFNYTPDDLLNPAFTIDKKQLPILDPARFFFSQIDLDLSATNEETIGLIRSVGRDFASILAEVLPYAAPSFFSKVNQIHLAFQYRFLYRISYQRSQFGVLISDALTDWSHNRAEIALIKTETLVGEIRAYVKGEINVPVGARVYGVGVFYSLLFLLEAYNLSIAIKKLRDGFNIQRGMETLSAILDAVGIFRQAVEVAGKFVSRNPKFQLPGGNSLKVLGVFTGVYAGIQSLHKANDAYDVGDLWAARAEVVSASLAGTGAVIGLAEVLGASVGGPWVAAIAAALAIGSSFVAYLNRSTPFEQLLRNNYMGAYWRAEYRVSFGPGNLLFNFNKLNGLPDFPRQISAFLSIMFPFEIEIIYHGPRRKLIIHIEYPTFITKHAYFILKRIRRLHNYYDVRHLFALPLFHSDDDSNGPSSRTISLANREEVKIEWAMTGDGARLFWWEIEFDLNLLKIQEDETIRYTYASDAELVWLEIDVSDNSLVYNLAPHAIPDAMDPGFEDVLFPVCMRRQVGVPLVIETN